MDNPHMLYRCPGPEKFEGVACETTVVDAPEVAAHLADGWHRDWIDADAAHKEALAAQIAANEAEQARIAAELAGPDPDADVIDPPPNAAGLRAVHKGRGKWSVLDAAGAEVQTGLTKDEALAAAA